ncbi:MAG: hypothetical protein OXR66_04610 [Candidatus Woesearchaeota archaeon]|nr:hypothetical protein [Candidatus Woesearchaeota archaeon]
MKVIPVFGGIALFVFGLLAGMYATSASDDGWVETPDELLFDVFAPVDKDVPTPSDHIPESGIKVWRDRVVFDVQDAQWAKFADTGSMLPTFGKDANAIQFVPRDEADVSVGDICSYRSDYADGFIIHRIIEEGVDAQGKYYKFKGDNLRTADPGKVRFDQLERCVLAIVY